MVEKCFIKRGLPFDDHLSPITQLRPVLQGVAAQTAISNDLESHSQRTNRKDLKLKDIAGNTPSNDPVDRVMKVLMRKNQ